MCLWLLSLWVYGLVLSLAGHGRGGGGDLWVCDEAVALAWRLETSGIHVNGEGVACRSRYSKYILLKKSVPVAVNEPLLRRPVAEEEANSYRYFSSLFSACSALLVQLFLFFSDSPLPLP